MTAKVIQGKNRSWFYCRLIDLLPQHYWFRSINQLSIGEQRKLMLTVCIAQRPDLLILDEPTNHLDFITAEYLEQQLLEYQGTLIVVSHDRYFIEKMEPVSRLWNIADNHVVLCQLPNL